MDPYITTCTIKGRNETLDIMKAITIILVIVGHCKIPSEYRDLIFSFHMPLFFVIGGYFFKPDSSSSLMKKSAKRLLIPYAVTGLFTAFFVMLGGNYHNAIESLLGVFWGNNGSPVAVYKMPMSGPVWFLLALFWCRVIFNYLYSFTNYWFFYSIILSVLASGFGYYFFNPPLGILIGMTALVFYALGLLFRIHKVKIGGGVFFS